MNGCFCTGACSRTGRCPNQTTTWPYPNTIPGVYPQPQRPAVVPTPPTIIVQPGPSEDRIREIIRDELERAKGKP